MGGDVLDPQPAETLSERQACPVLDRGKPELSERKEAQRGTAGIKSWAKLS